MRKLHTSAANFRKLLRTKSQRKHLEDLIEPLSSSNSAHTTLLPNIQIPCVNLSKNYVESLLDDFNKKLIIKNLAMEQGISGKIFDKSFESFKNYCATSNYIDVPLQMTLVDIKRDGHSIDLLFPYFTTHAKKIFPHLEYMTELKAISDMTQPHNWYPEARSIKRKIFFHSGPTNSGKTYSALQELKKARSGIYCGPLRLLVNEVYFKLNESGTPCDLMTGEDRRFAFSSEETASHLAITVEMLPVNIHSELAVIDEIQMLRDEQRGFAWTRALLGVAASQVHLCGEESAIDIVNTILEPIGESPVKVFRYERRNKLIFRTHGLRDFNNIQNGDCVVCFDKANIFKIAKMLKKEKERDCAIIFGDLPPATKLAQTAKFNDPTNSCKVLLATDAIGMGLNLNIKRIIFTTLMRSGTPLPDYSARQIAGRAGRFGSIYDVGEVMAFTDEDSKELVRKINNKIERIEAAGIAPTFEQIELFSLMLPHCSFVQLLDIFISICSINDNFFLCLMKQIRAMAEQIQSIDLSIKDRHTFCTVPIPTDRPFIMACIVTIVRRYSEGMAVTYDFLDRLIHHILKPAKDLNELNLLTDCYDVVGAYLWLSFKLEDFFPHRESVKKLEESVDKMISESLRLITSRHSVLSSRLNVGGRNKKLERIAKLEKLSEKLVALEKEIKRLSDS